LFLPCRSILPAGGIAQNHLWAYTVEMCEIDKNTELWLLKIRENISDVRILNPELVKFEFSFNNYYVRHRRRIKTPPVTPSEAPFPLPFFCLPSLLLLSLLLPSFPVPFLLTSLPTPFLPYPSFLPFPALLRSGALKSS